MKCRHCGADISLILVDLGCAPPSNAYVTEKALLTPEKCFPLRVFVCDKCWLVQTQDFIQAKDLFDVDYPYFSSYSISWLKHCKEYVSKMIERFKLTESSYVIEVAANDGYLLQYIKANNIPNIGIEPTASTAAAARAKGIEILEEFFNLENAKKFLHMYRQADLMIANNVLAHVPDINDFVKGFSILLKPHGVVTFEFPHLLQLIENKQFDTIYHEHFSYLSLFAVNKIFLSNGLTIFDVEELGSHGGSLRVYAQKKDTGNQKICENVNKILELEFKTGLRNKKYYTEFQNDINKIKNDLLKFLFQIKKEGKKIGAYGAAAKGNTLFNYAGIRRDLIPYIIDKNPSKINKYLPGSRIPIMNENYLKIDKPDYVFIVPWNISKEIMIQLNYIREWNGKFVLAIPELKIL